MSKLREFVANVVKKRKPVSKRAVSDQRDGPALGVLVDQADCGDRQPVADHFVERVARIFGEKMFKGRYKTPPPVAVPARETRAFSVIAQREVVGTHGAALVSGSLAGLRMSWECQNGGFGISKSIN
jgi:hypothetical protein